MSKMICARCENGDHGKCRDERAGGSGVQGFRCECCYPAVEIAVEPMESGDGWTVETVTAGEVDKADFRGPRAEARAKLFVKALRSGG